jgi:predicted dehydrogenase
LNICISLQLRGIPVFKFRPLALCVALAVVAFCNSALCVESPFVRVGILGLDNYQGLAYAEIFNSPKAEGNLAGVRVVAAYPVGSDDYPESAALIERWKTTFARFGSQEKGGLKDYHPVEMVDSIDALLSKCDVVMIMSLDGRLHLKQAEPVLKAGKRLYIGRPLATSLADAAAILKLAAETKTPCFSSSQHRYSPGFIGMRDHPEVGKVLGCDVYGGFEIKGPKADEFIRPLHSIETIYTIMGPGVVSVSCVSTPSAESYTLVWNDGRVGTYRGIKEGKIKYSATVFGDQGVSIAGIYGHGVPVQGVVPTKDKYMGYEGIAHEIAKFYKGGPTPVAASETLEIFAVLQAAELSKAQNGAVIRVADILKSVSP